LIGPQLFSRSHPLTEVLRSNHHRCARISSTDDVGHLCSSAVNSLIRSAHDPNATFYSPDRSCRRHVEGGTPTSF